MVLVSLFNDVSPFLGYLIKKNLVEQQLGYYFSHNWRGKGINSKVNLIARLEFEIAEWDVIVEHFSRYIT